MERQLPIPQKANGSSSRETLSNRYLPSHILRTTFQSMRNDRYANCLRKSQTNGRIHPHPSIHET